MGCDMTDQAGDIRKHARAQPLHPTSGTCSTKACDEVNARVLAGWNSSIIGDGLIQRANGCGQFLIEFCEWYFTTGSDLDLDDSLIIAPSVFQRATPTVHGEVLRNGDESRRVAAQQEMGPVCKTVQRGRRIIAPSRPPAIGGVQQKLIGHMLLSSTRSTRRAVWAGAVPMRVINTQHRVGTNRGEEPIAVAIERG